ncbi:hypothetical protein L2W88_01075 [Citrobacter freundii]|uniref:hypothetical protein n=1 Tax=Citrobacter freundii complex TaxID=1344959 RepID=UPI0023B210FE|nr:hypothetical protein [Citrobacter freundii]EKF5349696.1 hypothetical protein [Escherichia coli]EKK5442286.1 hypothetical protein [Escherichia coli]MCO0117040.1 hypothetical protein [Escherichia coli]MDE9652613.1 hypothetical protein [Citrobacter freundii]HBP4755265.1 hypothetical protein [Escherichia coli]
MNKTVIFMYSNGRHTKHTVPLKQESVIFPADPSLYPQEETRAEIEQLVHEGKTYWFARESQQAISIDRVMCAILGIE